MKGLNLLPFRKVVFLLVIHEIFQPTNSKIIFLQNMEFLMHLHRHLVALEPKIMSCSLHSLPLSGDKRFKTKTKVHFHAIPSARNNECHIKNFFLKRKKLHLPPIFTSIGSHDILSPFQGFTPTRNRGL